MILKATKKQYFCDLLQANKNNLVKVWQIINKLLGRNNKHDFPSFFMKNDNKIVKDKEIANEFNNYFSNISNIALNGLQQTNNTHFTDYLNKSCKASVYFHPTNESEILKIVSKLKTSKSTGFDNISSILIKKVIHSIVSPLVHIFNLSLCSGH